MSNPIKDKFIEHMQFFGLTKETQRGYISAVRCLASQQPSKDEGKCEILKFWTGNHEFSDY